MFMVGSLMVPEIFTPLLTCSMASEAKVLWIKGYVKDLCRVPGDSRHLCSRVVKTKNFLFLLSKRAEHEVAFIVC